MKKTLSFLLVLCMVFSLSVSAFAAELTPSTDKNSVEAGADVTVTLTLSEDISQVKNIGYMLRYNGDLFDFKGGEAGATAGVVISRAMKDKTSSFVRASFVDTTSQGVTMKQGVFAKLTFTAKANVSANENASFSLVYEGGDDVNGEITHTAGAAASVTVTPAAPAGYDLTLYGQILGSSINEKFADITGPDGGNGEEYTCLNTDKKTGLDVIKGVLDASGYSYVATATAITSVTDKNGVTLKNGDAAYGPKSGWTFTINGEKPGTYGITNLSEYVIDETQGFDGDEFRLIYVECATDSGKHDFGADGKCTVCGKTTEPAVYQVTFNTAKDDLPECLEGPASVKHGESYIFRLKEPYYSDHANYDFSNYSSIVKMGGKYVTGVKNNGDGTYTIENVTGDLVFTQRVSGRKLNCTVTVNQQKPETVDADSAPRYKTEYKYNYRDINSSSAADLYYTVTAKVGGQEVAVSTSLKRAGLICTIAAEDVTGDVALFIEVLPKTTAITLDGAAAADGSTSFTAETRKDFSFSLKTESGYRYTVKLGETVLTPDKNGQYTIPGSMISGEALTVKVTALAPTKIVVEGGELAEGSSDTAYAGEDFSFSLKTESGWKYTVKLGETVLTPDKNGQYTIPGSMISGEKLTVSVTRVKEETPSTVTPVGPAPAQPGETGKTDGVHTAFVSGYSDGSFRPLNRITRSETAAMLCRLLSDSEKQTALAAGKSFSDVTADAWYSESVSVLAGLGIINGRPDGSFAPTQNITRAEFAAMLTRFRTEGSESASVTFTDISGHWAESAIRTAAARGWVKGMTDGTFRPDEGITRAEAVTMICRMLGREPASAEALLSGMTEFTDNQNTAAWYYCYVQEAACGHGYRTTDAGEIWTELRK